MTPEEKKEWTSLVKLVGKLAHRIEAERILRGISTNILLEILEAGARPHPKANQAQFAKTLAKRVDRYLAELSDENPRLASEIRSMLKY